MAEKRKPRIRERMRGFEEVMSEVWSQLMGKLGIALIVALVLIAVYAIIVLPPDFPDLWTHNPKYWEVNPPLVPPSWIKYLGVPVAPHVVKLFDEPSEMGFAVFNFTLPGTATTILRAGYVENFTLTYRLDEPSFPTGLIVKYAKVVPANITGVKVQATVFVLVERPDGITVMVNSPRTSTLEELRERGVERWDPTTIVSQFAGLYYINPEKLQGYGIRLVFGNYFNGTLEPLTGTYRINVVVIYTAPGLSSDEIRRLLEEEGVGVREMLVVVQGSAYGLMGTDDKGRDLWLGLLFGFPIALLIGFFAAVASVVIGLIAGVVSGYYGGWVDETIQRTVDVIGNIPLLPVLVIIGVVLQEMNVDPWLRLFTIIAVIIVFGWGGLAIIVRSMTLSIKAEPYVDAAKALGASNLRIIFRHIVPQIVPYAMATLVFSVPTAILIEAGLSVLGIEHGLPTWGKMLADAEAYVRSGGSYAIWWWILPPGILIGITSLAFVLLGIALETVVEPRLRRR